MTAVTVKESTASAKETTVSAKECTVSAKEPTAFAKVSTVSAKETTVSAKESTVSAKECTMSAKEPTTFAKMSTASTKKTTVSAKETTVSAKECTVSAKETVFLSAKETKERIKECKAASKESKSKSKSSKSKPQPPLSRTGSTSHLLPEHHPAHALLSVAHALLAPASTIAKSIRRSSKPDLIPAVEETPTPVVTKPNESMLPIDEYDIDEIIMPESEVSDLRDVVDAINKLCDTMKTSNYEEQSELTETDADVGDSTLIESYSDTTNVSSYIDSTNEIIANPIVSYESNVSYSDTQNEDIVAYREIELSPEELLSNQKVEGNERWSDSLSQMSLPGQIDDLETVTSDTDPVQAQCEPVSEMYYTASSEVSLTSDETAEKAQNEDEERDDRKRVIAGHVAAMRERFESMTRTNTPCPDLIRSLSPSLEVFRNASPSPDRMA